MAAMPPNNPMAQLAQRQQPQGSGGTLMTMLLSFLAGAGMKGVVDTFQKLMGGPGGGRGAKGGQSGNQPHRAQGVSITGSAKPGVEMTPSAAGQGMPPGGQPGQGGAIPPALMQRIMQMMQSGGQNGPQ